MVAEGKGSKQNNNKIYNVHHSFIPLTFNIYKKEEFLTEKIFAYAVVENDYETWTSNNCGYAHCKASNIKQNNNNLPERIAAGLHTYVVVLESKI